MCGDVGPGRVMAGKVGVGEGQDEAMGLAVVHRVDGDQLDSGKHHSRPA